MKRKTGIVVLILSTMLLLFSMGMAYAVSGQPSYEGQLQVTQNAVPDQPTLNLLVARTCGFSRTGDLTARASVTATSSVKPNYIKAEVTVQKLNRTMGMYYDYADPYERVVTNEKSLNDLSTIHVGSSGTYRIKVVFTEDDAGEVTTFAPMYSKAEGL